MEVAHNWYHYKVCCGPDFSLSACSESKRTCFEETRRQSRWALIGPEVAHNCYHCKVCCESDISLSARSENIKTCFEETRRQSSWALVGPELAHNSQRHKEAVRAEPLLGLREPDRRHRTQTEKKRHTHTRAGTYTPMVGLIAQRSLHFRRASRNPDRQHVCAWTGAKGNMSKSSDSKRQNN